MRKEKRKKIMTLMQSRRGGTFLWTIIGICATAIVAAFIFIPGLRSWSNTIMTDTTTWWNTIKVSIFQTS